MGVTTSASIKESKLRCGACGKEAKGGVLIGRAGACCVRQSDRALLQSMIPADAPEPEEDFSFVAHDPFHGSGSRWQGASGISQGAAAVIGAARAKQLRLVGRANDPSVSDVARAEARRELGRYRQLTPEVVKELIAEGLPEPRVEPLGGPSIPPPVGDPDPLLDSLPPQSRHQRLGGRRKR